MADGMDTNHLFWFYLDIVATVVDRGAGDTEILPPSHFSFFFPLVHPRFFSSPPPLHLSPYDLRFKWRTRWGFNILKCPCFRGIVLKGQQLHLTFGTAVSVHCPVMAYMVAVRCMHNSVHDSLLIYLIQNVLALQHGIMSQVILRWNVMGAVKTAPTATQTEGQKVWFHVWSSYITAATYEINDSGVLPSPSWFVCWTSFILQTL